MCILHEEFERSNKASPPLISLISLFLSPSPPPPPLAFFIFHRISLLGNVFDTGNGVSSLLAGDAVSAWFLGVLGRCSRKPISNFSPLCERRSKMRFTVGCVCGVGERFFQKNPLHAQHTRGGGREDFNFFAEMTSLARAAYTRHFKDVPAEAC